jgi:site-specific DNA-methyltransferase (adenine-specific)
MNQLNKNKWSESPKNVVIVATKSIKSTSNKVGIYQIPANYELIKDNIKRMGLITPLIVDFSTKEIISGNLRHQIALELKIPMVPVIFEDFTDEKKMPISISTNQFRQKSSLEILDEMQYFDEYFEIKKGMRTDLNPESKEMKEKRDNSLKGVSKDKQNKLKAIRKMATNLYGTDTKEYRDVFDEIDNGSNSLNSVFKYLDLKSKTLKNKSIIPKDSNLLEDRVKIYNKSSVDMSELADESIQTIVVSPPYFQMVDYNTGKDQMGLESNVEDYLDNLMSVFKEAKRVLKTEGSLFVNLNDCVINGVYQTVPQKFVLKMIEFGFMLVDEFVWVKKNPNYSHGNRSVRNHEPIFHFVKSTDYYYNLSWMEDLKDDNNAISCGTNTKYPKLFSGLDYLINDVLRSNASSTAELRKECKKEGFYLTHSATFPLSIPSICILTTSKIGDNVLDFFSGTASTGESAIVLGRNYYGYETNPEYVMASKVRLNPYLNEEKEEEYLIAV